MGRMSAQDWAVGLVVLAAAIAVLRKLKRSWKGEADSGCDKCK
jgi:ABC-type transport system involved in cytochrome c biogenesis permease component